MRLHSFLLGLDSFALQRGERLILPKVNGRIRLSKSTQGDGRLLDLLYSDTGIKRNLIWYVHDARGFIAEKANS